MSHDDAPDFTIIGGGVVGMSIAYGLRRRNKSVLVLDEGDAAFRASRGNFALVWLSTKGRSMPRYSRWTHLSIALWKQFAEELRANTGIDVGLEQRGGFLLCLDEEQLRARVNERDSMVGLLGYDNYPVDILERAEVQRMLPAIGPDVLGGSFCSLDGHVNALRLFRALHAACQLLGVDYRANAKVNAIHPIADGFRVDTEGGSISSPRIVLAAGLGNAALAPMVGLAAPVRAERGQIIVTEKLDRILDYPVGTIRQTDEGSILIGASKEDAGFDTRTTTPVLADLASDAIRSFPIIERARVVRTWSALRVLSPDGCPIYDRSVQHSGAYLVTCHSGITLAAAHAFELASQLDGGFGDAFDAFSSRRFADVPKAA
jgi:hydrogen cyanide synthase HcnC